MRAKFPKPHPATMSHTVAASSEPRQRSLPFHSFSDWWQAFAANVVRDIHERENEAMLASGRFARTYGELVRSEDVFFRSNVYPSQCAVITNISTDD